MGRKPIQIEKGKHSNVHYRQRGKQVLLRVKIDGNSTPIDITVKHEKYKLKFQPDEFVNGRVVSPFIDGWREINNFLQHYKYDILEVADECYVANIQPTGTALVRMHYEKGMKILVTNEELEKKAKQIANNYLDGAEPSAADLHRKAKNELLKEKLVTNPHGFKPEEYYKQNVWNRNNIFELLGYIRYGTRLDASGDEVPILNETFHRLYKKLIYYRINNKPPEDKKQFNAEWVHNFYKFLRDNGFEKRLQKVIANPFILNSAFLKQKGTKVEHYGVNTFGDGIHKMMVRYINLLRRHKLIDNNFSKEIIVGDFTKKYGGKTSVYGDTIYYLTPKEFLAVLKNEVADDELNTTRHLFICQVMIGALRLKNLKGQKIYEEIDHYSRIRFKQAKVNNLLSNVMLKPVENILKLYNGKLPEMKDSEYNENLKKLFKVLTDDGKIRPRIITKAIKKLSGETSEEYLLQDFITNKFARSTYYVINGAMGVPFEEIAKRAGHTSTKIAMKHYYEVANGYTENDVKELLEFFK